jgi:hypothetical protein
MLCSPVWKSGNSHGTFLIFNSVSGVTLIHLIRLEAISFIALLGIRLDRDVQVIPSHFVGPSSLTESRWWCVHLLHEYR